MNLTAWRDWWSGLNRRQRLVSGLIGVTVVALLAVWVTGYAARPDYVPLFSGLGEADAGEIVRRLQESGVSYRFAQGGTAILVPADQVYETRMRLAADGLPAGGVVGFELIDKTKLGATEFERRVNYVRALQGELTRTIKQLADVREARVHVVLPSDSLFISSQRPASAAVFLQLRPGAQLDKGQVRGIVHLVASSVEGLDPANVTVVDTSGRILSAELSQGPGDAAALSRLEIRQQFQRDLERSLSQLLEQVLGPGNAVVRVTADMNFDERVVDRNYFEPVADESGILRSIQELSESFRGSNEVAVGVPGTTSNVPTYGTDSGSSGEATSERIQVTKNFELNEIRERMVVAPGTVTRMSVSVIVNGSLEPAQEAALEKAIAAAIGYDPARNDQITVLGLPFDTSAAEAAQQQLAAAEAVARRATWLRYAAYAVAAAVLFMLLRGRPAAPSAGRPSGAGSARAAQLAVAAAGAGGNAQPPGPSQPAAALAPRDRARMELQQQLEVLADERPETVAQLVRAWLAEE